MPRAKVRWPETGHSSGNGGSGSRPCPRCIAPPSCCRQRWPRQDVPTARTLPFRARPAEAAPGPLPGSRPPSRQPPRADIHGRDRRAVLRCPAQHISDHRPGRKHASLGLVVPVAALQRDKLGRKLEHGCGFTGKRIVPCASQPRQTLRCNLAQPLGPVRRQTHEKARILPREPFAQGLDQRHALVGGARRKVARQKPACHRRILRVKPPEPLQPLGPRMVKPGLGQERVALHAPIGLPELRRAIDRGQIGRRGGIHSARCRTRPRRAVKVASQRGARSDRSARSLQARGLNASGRSGRSSAGRSGFTFTIGANGGRRMRSY